MIGADWLQAVAVVVIGGMVGIGELVGRYKDDPVAAVINRAAVLYTIVNASAALLALLFVRAFGLKFGLSALVGEGAAGASGIAAAQGLVAAFGAMAVLRSSIFTARIGDQDVAVGPGALLHAVLAATDRQVDRNRAQARASAVADAMKDVSFALHSEDLSTLSLALMQNLPIEDQNLLANKVKLLGANQTMEDKTKSLCLGLELMKLVGEDVLAAAVAALKKAAEMGGDDAQRVPPAVKQMGANLQTMAGPVADPGHDRSTEQW